VLHALPPLYFRAHPRVEASTFEYLVSRLDLTASDFFIRRPDGRNCPSVYSSQLLCFGSATMATRRLS